MDVKHPLIKDEELFFKKVIKNLEQNPKYEHKWNLIPVTEMAPETLYVFALRITSNIFKFFVTEYQKIPQTVDLYRIYKIYDKKKRNSYFTLEKAKTESVEKLPIEVTYPAQLLGKTDAEIREFLTSQEPVTDYFTIKNLKNLILSRPDLSSETFKVLMKKYYEQIQTQTRDISIILESGGNKNVAIYYIEFFLKRIRNNVTRFTDQTTMRIVLKKLFSYIAEEDLNFVKKVFEFVQTKNEKLAFLNAIIENGPKNAFYFAMRLLRDQNPEVRDTAKRYIESLKS